MGHIRLNYYSSIYHEMKLLVCTYECLVPLQCVLLYIYAAQGKCWYRKLTFQYGFVAWRTAWFKIKGKKSRKGYTFIGTPKDTSHALVSFCCGANMLFYLASSPVNVVSEADSDTCLGSKQTSERDKFWGWKIFQRLHLFFICASPSSVNALILLIFTVLLFIIVFKF